MTQRVLWTIVAFIALAGYGLVYRPAERETRENARMAAELYREAIADEAIVQRAAELRAVRARLDADIARLAGGTSGGAVTAAALRVFAEDARRFDVDVQSITPADASIRSTTRDELIAMPVTLGVRGHFRDLVALLSDLPRHDVLIGLDDIALTAHESAVSPSLDATVHLTIYRLDHSYRTEDLHAARTL